MILVGHVHSHIQSLSKFSILLKIRIHVQFQYFEMHNYLNKLIDTRWIIFASNKLFAPTTELESLLHGGWWFRFHHHLPLFTGILELPKRWEQLLGDGEISKTIGWMMNDGWYTVPLIHTKAIGNLVLCQTNKQTEIMEVGCVVK